MTRTATERPTAPPRPSHAEASRALLRESVLDAVGELLADDAWPDVTMSEVATAAGVSRQTLYNAFGGREELAQAYLLRESERFLAAVADAVTSNAHDPHVALERALAEFLSLAATHPIVSAITSGDNDDLLALATIRGGGLIATTTEGLAGLMVATWPTVEAADARLAAETLIRLAISHAALPGAEPERTASEISRLLGPFIDERIAGG